LEGEIFLSAVRLFSPEGFPREFFKEGDEISGGYVRGREGFQGELSL